MNSFVSFEHIVFGFNMIIMVMLIIMYVNNENIREDKRKRNTCYLEGCQQKPKKNHHGSHGRRTSTSSIKCNRIHFSHYHVSSLYRDV